MPDICIKRNHCLRETSTTYNYHRSTARRRDLCIPRLIRDVANTASP